mgnify:CR=1 FL=1
MTTDGRVALVTGANKGIGHEIARQLGVAGITVLVGARDADRGKAAANELRQLGIDARNMPLDLNDEQSILEAARTIERDFGKLDILVNNAGVTDPEDGVPSIASTSALRRIMETNFIGTHAVSKAMLPLVKQAPAGRIVNLSSSLGSLTLNGDPTSTYYAAQLLGYNASKAALNMLTVQLSEELRGTPATVNSISPGFVKTDLNGHTGHLSVEEGARLPVQFALQGDDAVSGQFVEAGAQTPW